PSAIAKTVEGIRIRPSLSARIDLPISLDHIVQAPHHPRTSRNRGGLPGPAELACRDSRSCFIIDYTCGQALTPPSTVRFAPLMYDDSGPATNATSAATSPVCPYRSSGTAAFCPAAHSPEAGFRSVSIGPGWTLLTVMPRAPSSRASPCVNILMAPLVAE